MRWIDSEYVRLIIGGLVTNKWAYSENLIQRKTEMAAEIFPIRLNLSF